MNVIKFFRKNLDKKGFTLVELLLVIALLAVIGGVFVPRLFGTLDNAKADADMASANNLAHQAELLLATGGMTIVDQDAAQNVTALLKATVPSPQVGSVPFAVVYNRGTKTITAGYGAADSVAPVGGGTDKDEPMVTLLLTELDL